MDLRDLKFGIEIETIRRTRQAVAEAKRCGYKMSGFILAQGLRRMVEAGDPR